MDSRCRILSETTMLSGKLESLPYSFSRWTDVPISKWDWFCTCLRNGWFYGFDPRTAVPSKWSLKPEDVFGLIFWTKNPENIIRGHKQLQGYPVVVHVTLTGWVEEEIGAPDIREGTRLLRQAVETFSPDRVIWRFSPVPTVKPDSRFGDILDGLKGSGLNKVYVSFLQENAMMPERRGPEQRGKIIRDLAWIGQEYGTTIRLCRDDKTTLVSENTQNLEYGVCEDGGIFGLQTPLKEDCGCALAVDPFTLNESCLLGCRYCYAGNRCWPG